MRTLIRNEDLKSLLQGAAVVAIVGLLMGAVAHPNLRGEGAAGPQIRMAGGGPRGVQTISDPGVGVYGGRLPEYVIGTDASRPRPEPSWGTAASQPEPQQDRGPAVVFTSDDDYSGQMQMTRPAWRDEPRPEPAFPSARGGVPYEANLPIPPPAPGADEDEDEQALDLG